MNYPNLEKLFDDLSKITPLKMRSFPQKPGNEYNIFLLEKCGENYYLLPSPLFGRTNLSPPPLFDGLFVYVILASHPQQVMVAADRTNLNYDYRLGVQGHASVSLGRDALYAGDLEFLGGKLVRWNHNSGHYLPSPEQRYTQLTPNVKRLLPEKLFVDPLQH
ncbi:hypothetical protein [Endozoicomonas euniceicola]|uniref:Uncharacterized protein n=1 Tax=Endozoicomonas euniceicola TaxID=1234143 RepID=A0ABY6GZ92_9GAMM|nr:hypothetical protein [Endozoicomonas euniceicola]UYM18119.1 hypothetical protein NX720_09495 [Endozoicomonas euniceicola]